MTTSSPIELTIVHAAAWRERWLEAVGNEAAEPSFALDLSSVAEIDSAGVQLLLSLRRLLRSQGRTLGLKGNACVQEALETLGLAASFGACTPG